MLVLIEGCDGAGKSTLARRLQGLAPEGALEIRHCGAPTKPPLEEYLGDLEDYDPHGPRHIVYDRHYLGELVYGPLWRRESSITTFKLTQIEDRLNYLGAVLVLMDFPVDVIIKRLREKGEQLLALDDVPVVLRTFQRVAATSRLAHVVYFHHDPDDEDVWAVFELGMRAAREAKVHG